MSSIHFVGKRTNSSSPVLPGSVSNGPAIGHAPRVGFDHSHKLRTPRPLAQPDILFRVELALSRLENGDYGYCVTCDGPISIAQLEDDPSAVVCNTCRPVRV
ncbi:TraR/DksA family transcriptional regulator [Ponticaulis profundi]|uniref:TraR/DksA family transcriptional regulator n=1 Tax=Ponticaulis profundi TaxID=2665222 RepID=A0ABW1SA45_9PROT